MIIAGPGVPANERRSESVLIADLYPTILDYLGFDVPETCQAKPLTETFEKEKKIRKSLRLRYRNHIAGLKRDGFKLIKYLHGPKPVYSLFNLSEDPDELIDLSSDPAYTQLFEDMLRELDEGWEELEL
jgi:choline-sulfatase